MLRVLQQFILTTLFAVFASQASAMFIQPDWFDPTQPGVGTNRYAYSGNDPINRSDPNGNWFGVDDAFTGPIDELAVLGLLGLGAYLGVPGAQDALDKLAETIGNVLGGSSTSGVEINGNVMSSEINPELHEGQQGKHVPGHNNHDPERSPIAEGIDPGELVGGAAEGDYPQVGTGARGDPIFDLGKVIGTDAKSGKKTPYGTVQSGKKGSHVVPANPDKVQEQMAENEQEQGDEEDGSSSD